MTPQTVTITTARGETFTLNFDGPVSVEVKDVHLSPFEVGHVVGNAVDGKSNCGVGPSVQVAKRLNGPISTAPKFKPGDVVYWEGGDGRYYYGRVVEVYGEYVRYERLTTCHDALAPIGGVANMHQSYLHHDYRTVAGGGWRKCEVGKVYKIAGGGRWVHNGLRHNENGWSKDSIPCLIEELP